MHSVSVSPAGSRRCVTDNGSRASEYLPGLDGLRGISICLVIYAHLSETSALPTALHAGTLGTAGVIIFFAISGFLITRQLYAEWNLFGTVHIATFMMRRAFRLWPALLLMLTVESVLVGLGLIRFAPGEFLYGITYSLNYFSGTTVTLDHLWSLAVEEQFYLAWPIALKLAGPTFGSRICVAAVVVSPVIRLIERNHHMNGFRHFECAADSVAIGCLLAFGDVHLERLFRATAFKSGALAFLTMILCCLLNKLHPEYLYATTTIENICAILLVNEAIRACGVAGKVLTAKPLVAIGRVSYSLYLWQQLFIVAGQHYGSRALVFAFPTNLVALALSSAISYRYIEVPLRKLGHRLYQTATRKNSSISRTEAWN